MGLPVAELTETEEVALQVCNSIKSDQILDIIQNQKLIYFQELARCEMSSIIGDRPLLVGGGNSLCKFQMMDGTYEDSDVSFKIFSLSTKKYSFFAFCKGSKLSQ